MRPFGAELVAISSGSGAAEIAHASLPLVEWQVTPPFERAGRTSWIIREDLPVALGMSPLVRALKLKGVGFSAPGLPAIPPSPTETFFQPSDHVGIKEDGQFCLLRSEPSPLGGIFLDRALAEFRNATLLMQSGCPGIVPVAVYRYRDFRAVWQPDRPLGAVLSGSPRGDSARANALFDADPSDVSWDALACTEMLQLLAPDRVLATAYLAKEYGRTLREFHESGLYRHNGHPSNYFLMPGSRRVGFTDLDSSRLLSECSPVRRSLEILRDIAGGLFNLAAALVHPPSIQRFTSLRLRQVGPFDYLLAGYFGSEGITDSCVAPSFVDHFFRCHANILERRDEILMSPEGSLVFDQLRMDRVFVYATLILSLVPVYVRSAMSRRYPVLLEQDEIARYALAFVPEAVKSMVTEKARMSPCS